MEPSVVVRSGSC